MAELQHQVDHLLHALSSQRMIGIAVGLIAHRNSCPSSTAWEILARYSQDTNQKVREIARVLVDICDGSPRPEDAELVAAVRSGLPGAPWM